MKNLLIESSKNTPDVFGDFNKGELIISGKLITRNTGEFFKPILEWLHCFLVEKPTSLDIVLDIGYLSTSGSHYILELMKLAQNRKDKELQIKFYWHYPKDDEDLMETGEDFQSFAKVPFVLVER